MNPFSIVLEMSEVEEGTIFDKIRKYSDDYSRAYYEKRPYLNNPMKASQKPEPKSIDSPFGELKVSRRASILETVNPVKFKVFGKEYSCNCTFKNIGTEENPKYSDIEIKTLQKSIQSLSSMSNDICKAVYAYVIKVEEGFFEDYDYDFKKKMSPTARSLKTISGCVKFFDTISIGVWHYFKKTPVIYLQLINDEMWGNSAESDIICTVYPKIVVGSMDNAICARAEM